MIAEWLQSIPPLAVYLTVLGVVGVESFGIPLPGEIVLVSATLMATRPELAVSAIWVAVAALIGAVVGDSIGFAVGRRYGIGAAPGGGAALPAALRSLAPRPRRARVRALGRADGDRGPLHRDPADLRGSAGRRAAHAVPEVHARERRRRGALDVRHDGGGVRARDRGRDLAEAVLLGRPDRRGDRGPDRGVPRQEARDRAAHTSPGRVRRPPERVPRAPTVRRRYSWPTHPRSPTSTTPRSRP